MLTVHEALELPAFRGTKLLAGQEGLDRSIKWVTTIEIIEDITRFQEGELIITTGFGLEDNESSQQRFLELIRSEKLAGIAICSGFYINDIPVRFIDEAAAHQLPLLHIPPKVNFSALTKGVLEQIVNKQTRLLENSLLVHQEMTKLAFNLDGLPNTLKKISPLTRASIYVFNESLEISAFVKKEAHDFSVKTDNLTAGKESVAIKSLIENMETDKKPFHIGDYICTFSTIKSETVIYGYLLSVHHFKDWSEMDAVISNHIATLIGIEMVKKYAVDETKVRIQGEFVEEILHKEHLHYMETLKRGERLGYDLTLPHFAVYVKVPFQTFDKSLSSQTGTRLYYYASQALHASGRQIILLPKMNELYALVESFTKDEAEEKALFLTYLEDLQAKWSGYSSEPLKIGVGKTYLNLASFSESAREAENAVYYSDLLLNHSSVVHYDDLGFYQVLIQMENSGVSLEEYYKKYLGELITPGRERKDLIKTLEGYLANNCHLQQTASSLFIHRHTLKYRLAQIEKKTGLNLQSADSRFNLHLAIVAFKFSELTKTK
ncbi:PucR family transcriptional regulator ligand-binding domain-containing protein [Salipaludibacillus sp. CUR1]|uniref:PucR family transcriptional regulator n=1 Tax=Salipaludibacillus sp. CUR1 TaxID=2820003 RepID=UPI001E32DE4C|nr:PucR family transcriptional regulator [Salipaludibacillus sp. CUR1]MCE7793219.1 PucR family transcriptional regulator ligand-binding domain-containing protein [Salipaludibacillus sp. CUR1]